MSMSARFQLYPQQLLRSWFFPTNLILVAITTNQTERNFCQNICNEIAINANFHFSHFKSIETLSCHSNKRKWATAIKNTSFVETNIMNSSAKFLLHSPYGFWEMIFEYLFVFFFKFIEPFGCHGNQSNSEDWIKMIYLIEDNWRNISVKLCQNICCEIAIKAYFHFSHYVNGNFQLP